MKKLLLFPFCIIAFSVISNAQSTALWGTTTNGGTFNGGTIFKINPNGTGFTSQFNFSSPDGYHPVGNLILASDGNFYGACRDGGDSSSCTIFRHNRFTNIHTDVYNFGTFQGSVPESGLVEGQNGVLYGTTNYGGLNGDGVIYSFNTTNDVYTDLFDLNNIVTGSNPSAVPIVVNNKLYGTTSDFIYSYDISTNIYTVIHHFIGPGDGSYAFGSVFLANDGNLYGMTHGGGINGQGIIYRIQLPSNTYTKLFDFDNTTGTQPYGAFMQGLDGKLYAVTFLGGINNKGVIFSFNITNNTYTTMYDFSLASGGFSQTTLTQDANGILYGSAAGSSNGVIFTYDLANNIYSVLYNFNGSDGSGPKCSLLPVEDVAIGIKNFTSPDGNIIAYPNPATDRLNININTINFQPSEITISNIQGEKVMTLMMNKPENTIDMNSLRSGLYFLEMNVDGKKSVMKIAKE